MTTTDWQNLATWVERARTAARLTQSDLKPLGGPSGTLVRQIEKARVTSLSARTKTGLETVLGWEIGVVDELLAGANEPRMRGDLMPRAPGWRFGDPSPLDERGDQGRQEELEEAVLAAASTDALLAELSRRTRGATGYQRRTAAQDAAEAGDQGEGPEGGA